MSYQDFLARKSVIDPDTGLTEFCGENPPIHGNLSHERWRRYASQVWMDINFSNTLNAKAARDNEGERHVCPMALDNAQAMRIIDVPAVESQ